MCSNVLNSYLPDVEFFCGHHFESGADIPLKAFHQSVRNDIMAAKGVTDNLNPNKLREFVKAIDECQGQILISGIGEHTNFSYFWLPTLAVNKTCNAVVHVSISYLF